MCRYADYVALSPSLFTLNRPSVLHRSPSAHQTMVTRTTDGLCALLLSLKKSPLQIRFSSQSKLAKELASEVKYRIAQVWNEIGVSSFDNRWSGSCFV